jgi:hypothetical protein
MPYRGTSGGRSIHTEPCEAIGTVTQEPGQLTPFIRHCGKPGKLRREWFKPFGLVLCDECFEQKRERY